MTRHDAAARRALRHADEGRRVVVVGSNAYRATSVYWAIVAQLQERPGKEWIAKASNGRWEIKPNRAQPGRIDVRVQGVGLRGMSADVVLIDTLCRRPAHVDSALIVLASAGRLVRRW